MPAPRKIQRNCKKHRAGISGQMHRGSGVDLPFFPDKKQDAHHAEKKFIASQFRLGVLGKETDYEVYDQA